MIKNLLTYRFGFLLKAISCLSLFLALGTTNVMAQFAITEDFRGNGNPDIIIGGPGGTEGTATLTSGGVDPVNGGFLRLTNSNTYQKGYAYVNKSFPSTMGVLVDFEYKMWRDVNDANNGADGIGVFLFDASSTFKLGGYGGSLGYAPNNPTTGLTGGYVGVGLDAYGNYSNESEWRIGGPGETPNAVVLRGPTTGTASTTNRYLTGVALGDRSGTNNNIRARNELDYNTVTPTRPSDTDFYRRVQIEILRLDAAGIYYKIVVRWKKTPTSAFTDLVEYTTTDVPPSLLKLGFAASSGASRNFHEIRNLVVTTPGNLRVVKRANKDILRTNNAANGTITYTIEVTNDTNIEVQNVGFTDQITDSFGNPVPVGAGGFTISSITTSGFVSASLPTPGLLTTNEITGSLVLAAFATGTITVTGVLNAIPPGNVLQNTANVTYFNDNDLNNNTSTVRTPVTAEGVDIILTKTVSEQCITSGAGPLFTVYASNIGVNPVSYTRWGTATGTRIAFYNVVPPGYNYSDNIMTTDTSLGGFAGTDTDPQNSNVSARWSRVVLNNSPSPGYTTYGYIARGTDAGGASQQLLAGATYPYPLKYTMSPPSGTTTYTDVSTAILFNDANFNNQLEPAANQTNNTASIDMYVKPAAPAVPAGTVYYCIDDTASPLQATATGTNTLRWYTTPNGFSSEYPITPNTNWQGTFTYYVSQVNGDCEGPQTPITVRIGNDPGTISAAAFVCPGTSTTISGTAVSGTYRWQSATNINGPWTNMTGTSKDRSSGNLSVSTYFRRLNTVTVNGKTCETPSNIFLISVNNPGTIGDPQTSCSNGNFDADPLYSVVAPVGNVTGYQWQRKRNLGDNWADVPNGNGDPVGTNATYDPASTNRSYYYQRLVYFSGCTIASNSIRITVDTDAPTGGTISASATNVCNGTSVTFSNGTSGGTDTVSYQWQSSPTGGNNTWVNIPGATNDNYITPPLSATTYFRRLAINSCGTGTTTGVGITVNNPAKGTISSSQTICYGATPSAITSPQTGTTGYKWEYAEGTSGDNWQSMTNTSATITLPALTASRRYRRYKVTSGCQSDPTDVITITVKQQSNPGTLSTTTPIICFGTSALITGTPATSDDAVTGYQWQVSANGTNGWTTPGGITTGQNYTATATGYYRRVATLNPSACGPINTPNIQITVRAAVSAGTMSGNQTICNNTTATITGSAETPAASITYRWEMATSAGGPFSTAPGTSNGQNYTTPQLTATGYFRRIVISTVSGIACESAAPTAVVITVSAVPVVDPGVIGTSQIVCSGTQPPNIVTTGTTGTGTSPYNYLWQYSTDGVNWTTNPSQQSDTYFFNSPVVLLTQTTYFRRFGVTSCPGSTPSNIVTYTVPAIPNPGSIGSDQLNVCRLSMPAMLTSVSDAASGTTYQWQISTAASGSTWTNIPGATSATYQPDPVETMYFRRLAVYGSCSVASNVVRISSTITMSAGAIVGDQTVCYNVNPTTITSSDNGYSGAYRWDRSPDGVTWTNTTVNTAQYTFSAPLTATTYFRRAMVGTSCVGEIYSNTVIKTVTTAPIGGTGNGNQTICNGTAPATALSVSGGSTGTYSWEYSTNSATGPWSAVSPAATGDTYSPGILNTTTYYRRRVAPGSCTGQAYSTTITITVSAPINGGTASANKNYCNGDTITPITVTGGGAGTWRWDISSTGLDGSWSPVSPSATGASYTPVSIAGTRYYRRTTISGGCEGYSTTVTVSVSAAMTAGSITGTQTICMDTIPSILGSASAGLGTGSPTISYRWEVSANGSTGWATIPGATDPTYQPLVLHATRYYRRYTVSTSTIGGVTATCESGPTGTVIVTTKNCKVITNPMVRSRVN